ncbi:MAG: hypothetical protein ACRD0A_21005 [Acidimicrobiales bacterium]
MLLVGGLVLATGLLILVVPKRVQTGNPALGQVGGGDTGSYSCGSAFMYAIGQEPSEDSNPDAYSENRFTTVAEVCPPRLRSNLNASIVWLATGIGILLVRWFFVRGHERERAELRQPLSR